MKRRDFIKIMALGVSVIICDGFWSPGSSRNSLTLHMIYNNIGHDPLFQNNWGVAIWVEKDGKSILFDTGGDPQILSANLKAAGRDVRSLSAIFISHNHWDHVNGLSKILEEAEYRPTVFVPASALEKLQEMNKKAKFTGIKDQSKLIGNFWSTGEIPGRNIDIGEQALLIPHEDKIYILTGCSHPGVVTIVEKAKSIFPDRRVALVAGGFHMLKHSLAEIEEVSAKLAAQEIEKLAPSHCTGETVTLILKEEWKERCIDFNNGNVLIY